MMANLKNGLRYTLANGRLTTAQRIFYEENGYLVVPKLIENDILDECHRRFEDIVSGKVPRDGMVVMYDVKDRKSVNKIQEINRDEVFRKYIEHPKILDLVEVVTGPNIMAVHSMLIAKPPDIGYGSSRHPPHQDLYYFPFRPADRIVASWTAMEPCTRENGCLYVAAGSHRQDHLHPHDYPPGIINKFYHGILDLPKTITWSYLEMEPGDTVFFHPLLIHGSGVNTTTRSRRSISCHYAAAECHYVDVENTVQSRIKEEVMQHVSKRYPGINASYSDLWQFRATLVRGIRSNL